MSHCTCQDTCDMHRQGGVAYWAAELLQCDWSPLSFFQNERNKKPERLFCWPKSWLGRLRRIRQLRPVLSLVLSRNHDGKSHIYLSKMQVEFMFPPQPRKTGYFDSSNSRYRTYDLSSWFPLVIFFFIFILDQPIKNYSKSKIIIK